MRNYKKINSVGTATLIVASLLTTFAYGKPTTRADLKLKQLPHTLPLVGTSSWQLQNFPVVSGQGHENHRGSSWCDYDNDGFLDLYLAHFGVFDPNIEYSGSPNQLLKNVGDGDFVDVTTTELAIGDDLTHHAAWADMNNDGLPDLFVGQSSNFGTDQSYLLRHTEVGEFEEITNGEPLAMYGISPRGVTWADVDSDGLVDLFITNSGGDDLRNRLMINNGDGTFERLENSALVAQGVEGRGIAWSDYNNDNLPDVYICAGSEDNLDQAGRTNALFKNNGDGTFTNVGEEAGVADLRHGRGVAWGDINNDGFMDILVGNQVGSDIGGQNRLFRANGDGTYEDISDSSGIVENKRTRCVSMADYDNDGLIDLYTVQFGSLLPPNRLYHNNGDGTFAEVAQGTQAIGTFNGDSATWADYDNDGWIDLYLVGGSLSVPGIGQNILLRNTNHNGNHWIEFELCGTISNRTAIGARVTVVRTNSDGVVSSQIREVQSGSGYNSQHMLRTHFGLGDSEVIDEVTVRWPSGMVQTATDVAVDQIIRVVEHHEYATDCNRNCVADVSDIETGTSADADGNGIPDECECRADFNNNGEVEINDFLILFAYWGASGPEADLTGDNTVDIQDLLVLIISFGPCPN
jgi:enediyne biosynthesis protein E4